MILLQMAIQMQAISFNPGDFCQKCHSHMVPPAPSSCQVSYLQPAGHDQKSPAEHEQQR
jgi:hypothetical protein